MPKLVFAASVPAIDWNTRSTGTPCPISCNVVVTWVSSHDLFRRIEYGLVASSLAALVTFAIALRSRLRAGATPSHQSIMEAVIDMPFET